LRFSRAFIELIVQFARHVAQIQILPLDDTLFRFTPLYLSLGLGRDFDPRHPTWQAFMVGLAEDRDVVDWTHTFYLSHHANVSADAVALRPTFGCFYYSRWPENRVRIHFRNDEIDPHGPLDRDRRPKRLAELTAMFSHLSEIVPPTATVVGGSWLYNIEAYRRLFPPEFLATARTGANEYRFLALWGQFLDRHGHLRATTARTFLDGLGRHLTEESLEHCFPYRVLRLESAVRPFYEFYGIV
jgi:hypothetical protein